mmetsp:Transcript_22581/g.72270  ORF Transcript_22581/g.72270 Transcript_22581/m.72270 type:complete len:204 (+) Transcript_22581:1852-2463(+)
MPAGHLFHPVCPTRVGMQLAMKPVDVLEPRHAFLDELFVIKPTRVIAEETGHVIEPGVDHRHELAGPIDALFPERQPACHDFRRGSPRQLDAGLCHERRVRVERPKHIGWLNVQDLRVERQKQERVRTRGEFRFHHCGFKDFGALHIAEPARRLENHVRLAAQEPAPPIRVVGPQARESLRNVAGGPRREDDGAALQLRVLLH